MVFNISLLKHYPAHINKLVCIDYRGIWRAIVNVKFSSSIIFFLLRPQRCSGSSDFCGVEYTLLWTFQFTFGMSHIRQEIQTKYWFLLVICLLAFPCLTVECWGSMEWLFFRKERYLLGWNKKIFLYIYIYIFLYTFFYI